MSKKIPTDAFDFYFGLGPQRSYEAVAKEYKVSKRAVTALAKRERWQERLERVENEAREKSDKKKSEVLGAAREQHLQALRLVLGKGIEGLRRMQIVSPRDAIHAIGLAVREIRVELGEPSDRTAVSIEDTIRREYERWMTTTGSDPDEEGGSESVDGEVPEKEVEDDGDDEDPQQAPPLS